MASKSITVRVRGTDGTQKNLSVDEQATVAEFRERVGALFSVPGPSVKLSLERTLEPELSSDTATLNHTKIGNGSVVYFVDKRIATAGEAKCNHPPQFTCLLCAADKVTGAPKCNHGSHTTCLICMPAVDKAEAARRRCRHPPSTRCVNCPPLPAAVAPKVAPRRFACAHPAHVVCPNCTRAPEPSGTAACTHPPTMRCSNCVTVSDEDDAKAREMYCRSHGPHGSCVNCLVRTQGEMPRISNPGTATVPYASFDRRVIEVFREGFLDEGGRFREHRLGHMYGTVNAEGGVVVDAVYEPRQRPDVGHGFDLLEDPLQQKAEMVAASLDLDRLGVLFTRDASGKRVLSANDILMIAQLQQQGGARFVAGMLSVVDGVIQLVAVQLTEQAIALYKRGLFIPSADPEKMTMAAPVLLEGAETTEVPIEFFFCNVPVRAHEGSLSRGFPIENRPNNPVRDSDFKVHMLHNAKLPLIDRLSDFHLLISLTKMFDEQTMEALATAVKTRNLDAYEGIRLLIESIVNS